MAKTGRGRPTKYDAETMLPILAELADGQGAFMEELPHRLGITKSTLWEWMREDGPHYVGKEFSNAISEVIAARDAWLMDRVKGQINGTDPKEASATALVFALKNTVLWRDRSEVETTNTNRNIVIED